MMVRLSVGASLAGALLAILPQTLAQNGSFVCTGINAANNYNATISYLGCWTDTAVRTLNGKPHPSFSSVDPIPNKGSQDLKSTLRRTIRRSAQTLAATADTTSAASNIRLSVSAVPS